LIWRPICRVY